MAACVWTAAPSELDVSAWAWTAAPSACACIPASKAASSCVPAALSHLGARCYASEADGEWHPRLPDRLVRGFPPVMLAVCALELSESLD
jgi:hypothetical protein